MPLPPGFRSANEGLRRSLRKVRGLPTAKEYYRRDGASAERHYNAQTNDVEATVDGDELASFFVFVVGVAAATTATTAYNRATYDYDLLPGPMWLQRSLRGVPADEGRFLRRCAGQR